MRSLNLVIKRKFIITFIILISILISYLILERTLILDFSDKTLGIYDFGPMKTDAILVVEGTGIRKITEKHTGTELRVIQIKNNSGQLPIKINETIEANEYLDVFSSKRVAFTLFMPGRSIYGMGTGYKSVGKNEKRVVHILTSRDRKEYWIIPDKFVEK